MAQTHIYFPLSGEGIVQACLSGRRNGAVLSRRSATGLRDNTAPLQLGTETWLKSNAWGGILLNVQTTRGSIILMI